MKIQQVNICYFPTTVVVVDDDRGLQTSIKRVLGNDNILIKGYTDPGAALKFLNDEYDFPPLNEHFLESDEAEMDRIATFSDLRAVDQKIYEPDRSGQIAVVVVDFAMPTKDGLQFCRELKRKDIRIILLTGEAGLDLAVKAFNDSLIHQFLLKDSANVYQSLLEAIQGQQRKYFEWQTELTLRNTQQTEAINGQLHDPVFVKFFSELCEKERVVEYYLLDSEGSFLLVTATGGVSILALKTDDILDSYWQMADSIEIAPPEVLNALKDHTHVPLFYRGEDLQTPPEHWFPFLHKATLLKGDYANYYYAFLPNVEKLGVKKENIVPYQDYFDVEDSKD